MKNHPMDSQLQLSCALLHVPRMLCMLCLLCSSLARPSAGQAVALSCDTQEELIANYRKELVEEGRVCRPLAMEAPLLQPGLEGYTVTPGGAGWREEALRIFRRAGVVVIRGGLPAEACTRLHDACRRAESEVRILHPRGNRGPERCSFGKASVTGSTLHLQLPP